MVTELIVKQNLELQAENERLKYDLKVLQHELDECRKVLKIQKEAQARLKDTKSKYTAKEIIAMTELFRKEIKDLPLSFCVNSLLTIANIQKTCYLCRQKPASLLTLGSRCKHHCPR
jgi:hypothetical protein